jgi:hypothetical protein
MIEAVRNRAGNDREALSEDDPLLDQRFDDWDSRTERELRLEKKIEEAVQAELRRGNPLTDSVR